MAYASKSEQRLQLSRNYNGGKSTLDSDTYRKTGSMGDKPGRLVGQLVSKSDSSSEKKLYGAGVKAETSSGLAGYMGEKGYTDGPKWKRAMEPGELRPGKPSQAKNTTRMKLGVKAKGPTMKVTSTTPKVLRGGGKY